MSAWDAVAYDRLSALQRAMADEVLALIQLHGDERVLDVGCGNGRVTADLAARLPRGSILGVDSSSSMIEFAAGTPAAARLSNLSFQVANARSLRLHQEFDLVISSNALHWIPEQEQALQSIYDSLKPGCRAHLRLVPNGRRKSLEQVVEDTRCTGRWSAFFLGFHDPYLHLTLGEYVALAQRTGFNVLSATVSDKCWDFQSRSAFQAFCSAMLTSWTGKLPETEGAGFVQDVLDRYRAQTSTGPSDENTFKFYQMDVLLARPVHS